MYLGQLGSRAARREQVSGNSADSVKVSILHGLAANTRICALL